jgi:hypothetical protein
MNDSITKDQAIALAESRFWESLTHRQIAEFQMRTKKLCMPFGVFHEAMEKTLGRPVFTHEFGASWDALDAELRGDRPAPTFDEIIAMIPADKRVIVFTPPAS